MDQAILFALTYFLTGFGLVLYDMSVPPMGRKGYLRNPKLVLMTLLSWPYWAVFDTISAYRIKRHPFRFLFGVVKLLAGLYVWAQVVFIANLWFLGIKWLALIPTAVAMYFASTFLSAVAIPPHPYTLEYKKRKGGQPSIRSNKN